MAQLHPEGVKRLLHNKFIVIIGDSVQRGIYKDLIAVMQTNQLLSGSDLKAKGEASFMNDRLLDGGTKGVMHNGVDYREVREYRTQSHLVRFYFVTRVRNRYWLDVIFPALVQGPAPDVVVMNSCLWDISRYGPNGMREYCQNLTMTFRSLRTILPSRCKCIWNTTLPASNRMMGGFMLPEMAPLCASIRADVVAANYYARQQAAIYGVDILDLDSLAFQFMMGMQEADGIHWNEVAHRIITNVLLDHIARSESLTMNHHDFGRDRRTMYASSRVFSSPTTALNPHEQMPVFDFPGNVPKKGVYPLMSSPPQPAHEVGGGNVNRMMPAPSCQIVDFPENVPRNAEDLFKKQQSRPVWQ